MIENVGHWITITLTSGLRKEGYFYTMDPDKKSIILFNQDQAIVVFGHAIKEYQCKVYIYSIYICIYI